MNALVQISGPTTLAATDADLMQAMKFARAEKAPATRRAYRSDFAAFQSWCEVKGLAGLPAEPETIAAFLAFEEGRGVKAATIGRRVAAIRHAHKLAGHEPPTNSEVVKATVRGIRRTVGAAAARKAPIVAEVARAMAQAAPPSLKGLRDRALLLLGFAGAFRRSELVALDVSDIKEEEDGARVTIRRSKTDQEGMGVTIAIVRGGTAATCPVRALRAWLDAASIAEGAIFRPVAKGDELPTPHGLPQPGNRHSPAKRITSFAGCTASVHSAGQPHVAVGGAAGDALPAVRSSGRAADHRVSGRRARQRAPAHPGSRPGRRAVRT
jgi:site-specific recombinase XerC